MIFCRANGGIEYAGNQEQGETNDERVFEFLVFRCIGSNVEGINNDDMTSNEQERTYDMIQEPMMAGIW